MAYVDFIMKLHSGTKRDYVARVRDYDKAECATIAKQYGKDYWDGERQYGYGGYYYDGRWRPIAEAMVKHYGLKSGDKILDIGCGKGYLLYEFTQVLPDVEVAGIDISEYAITHAKPEIRGRLQEGNATHLPWDDDTFDLVLSINTFHNFYNFELDRALREIERVGKEHKYICVESYRTEAEKVNLLYWQVTCETFCTPEEWDWWFQVTGYSGDHSFIYFE